MASFAPSESVLRLCRRLGFCLLLTWTTFAIAQGQTVTYRLHKETSGSLFQLKTANPDATSVAIQSANLKNVATGDYVVKEFETLSGVPNASGVITSGSTISVTLWMKKTASAGTMFPRVKIHLNTSGGTSVAVVTGTTALTTTLTQLTLTGTVPSNVSMTTSDRFYVWVGVNLTAQTSSNNRGELNIEGTVNGNYDSKITLPLPVPPAPSISSLTPSAAAIGTSITIAGSAFGASQGTSTVTFNGVSATPTSWSDTSIGVPVPSGATNGSVVVTVNSQASNGASFTVTPKIDNVSPTSGLAGTSVTITGTTFGASQGSSTVTFNGTAATPTSWSNTSISAPVPGGATTGSVVVTVNGHASNGSSFTVVQSGSIGGTITRTSDSAPINGALIEALQTGVVKAFTTSAANGTYTLSNIEVGTYDVRVSAIGYQTSVQNGVVVTANTTTTVNKGLLAISPGAITYVNDELGRLVGVITTSEFATYSYDEVGNLLSISRGNSSLVSVIEFTPNGGPVGTEVKIFGTGFSVTPSQNIVKFNGVTATVVSSSETEIVTNVPSGATTGSITVTTAAGTGTSSTSFVVGGSLAPTISSFTPTNGVVGTSVIISGSNFETAFYNNKVKFNITDADATAATGTSITTTVPAGATSGRITVLTPEGSVTSTDDFFVAPPGYAAGDIAISGRMFIGEVRNLTFSAPGKIALLVFDGNAGQRITLGMGGVTLGNPCCTNVAATKIFMPNGMPLLVAGFMQDGYGSPTITLPFSGTYTILVDPEVANTGNVTVVLSDEITAPITMNGSTVSVDFAKAGQNAMLVFAGTAGQRVNVGLSGVTLGNPCCTNVGTVTVYNSNGSALLSPVGFMQEGYGSPTLVLPSTGAYAIAVDPVLALTGNVTVTLSEELANPITIDGSTVPLTISRKGQNARLTFSGTAGQHVAVGLSGVTFGNPCCTNVGVVAVEKPDGTALLSPVGFMQDGHGSPTLILPTTGTYAITIDPVLTHTGNVTVTLSEELANTITINGSTVPLSLNRVGQNARLTFEGTAGQRINLGLSGITVGNPCCNSVAVATIYKPDGTALLSPVGFMQEGYGSATLELPTTGTYVITIDPLLALTGNVTVTLSEEVSNSITIDGSTVPLSLSRVGQNARLTFSGTSGQRVSLGLSGITVGNPCCNNVAVATIYKPDGTAQLSPVGFMQEGYGSATLELPTTGTYVITIDPLLSHTGNVTVTLSEELSNSITIDGSTMPLSLSRVGQNARLTFSGTSGQRVSLGLSGVTVGNPCCSNVGVATIYKPDGTALLSPVGFMQEGYGSATLDLPTTGTYAITIDPLLAFTGNVTATLSEELSNSITINGSTVPLSMSRAGQNARLTFAGTANQLVSIGLSGVTIGNPCCSDVAVLTIFKPDGSTLVAPVGFAQGGLATATLVLPTTGSYAIAIDPVLVFTGNVTVTLSEDLSSSITINGSAVPLNISRVGQNASLTFNGTASSQITVAISGNTIGNITVKLVKPDGTTLTSSNSSSSSFSLATQTLPTTGVYTITVDPSGIITGNVSVTATSP